MTAQSWIDGAESSPFPLCNLPFGVFSTDGGARRRVAVAIGDFALDAGGLARDEAHACTALLDRPTLNPFLAAGPAVWAEVRAWLTRLLSATSARARVEPHLFGARDVQMHLPFEVADYVDFYASEHHATNLGRMFRPDGEALLPNWKHLPVGYHGRAGTVVVSDTPIARPLGQRKGPDDDAPGFGPSQRLDFEAELGFVVGVASARGRPVAAAEFPARVFGVCLVNDWSARDIQAWEYVPLGPFLGKSFATSISPWVVPLAALEGARVRPPPRDRELLPYLRDDDQTWALDIRFEVEINGHVVSRPPARELYWTGAQMLAHMTCGGANLRSGDLYASGTISGPNPDQWGSLIELSRGGREPMAVGDGTLRSFLEDGDEVVLRASAPGPAGGRIGLGEVRGRIGPAA